MMIMWWLDGFLDYGLGGQEIKFGIGGEFDEEVIWWWMIWSDAFLEPLPAAAGWDVIHVAMGTLRNYNVRNFNFMKFNTAIWAKISFMWFKIYIC